MALSNHHGLDSIDSGLLKATTFLAMVAAMIIAVLPPSLKFYYAFHHQRGSLAAEADSSARQISQIIGRNPEIWQFETHRINVILNDGTTTDQIRVTAQEDRLVTIVGAPDLKWPTTTMKAPLFDAGVEVGAIEIRRSLWPELIDGWLFLAFSTMLAAGVYVALRTLPLAVLRKVIARASFLASHDALTALPNRALFHDWLLQGITVAERQSSGLAVLCLDLDHFKDVNDIMGHAAGDQLLLQATARMNAILSGNDILARMGGDEFAIIQHDVATLGMAANTAEKLISAIAEPFDLDGQEVRIGVSIGITLLDPNDLVDDTKLLQQADLALYKAKADGKGRYCFFNEAMNEQLLHRKQMESDLRRALQNKEFELHFQPQINLATDELSGVEALLRWNHPTQGMVAPDTFIPLAEETGLILPIGEWVLFEACRLAQDWPSLKCAVNVSPVQFRQGNLVDIIRRALDASKIEPNRLEIEITEGVLLDHTVDTIATLTEIKAMGVRIAMDDFGTGYSSLNYLRRFSFDKIKIDKSFISGLGTSEQADNIVQAVIALGASLGMASNAEGVETVEQANILKQNGCGEVQGFYYGRPMPSASICDVLHDWEAMKESREVAGANSASAA